METENGITQIVQHYRILIVDDSPEDRVIYRRLLQKNSSSTYSFQDANTGKDGLVTCREFLPDCVLLDFHLPDMNGLEVLNRLQQCLRNPPAVVMLTGVGNEQIAVEALQSGAQDYLPKNVLTSELLWRTVVNAIEKATLQRIFKQQMQILRDSEERFRATFEQAPVGIAHVGLDGQWLLVNQKLCDIVGCTREELQQRSFKDLTFPDDLAADMVWMKHFLSGEVTVNSLEKRYVQKNGNLVHVRVTSTLVRDAAHAPSYFISIIEDIESQHQAEEYSARLAAIVQSSDDAILSKTLEGTITSWNTAAEQIYGYSAKEAIGQSISLIVPRDYITEIQRILSKVSNGDHVRHLETVRQRKNGELIDVSVTVSPVRNIAGKIIGASAIARDITERKSTEKMLRESEERWRLFVTHAPVALAMFDRQMRYLAVSDRWSLEYELGGQDLIGRSHYEVFPDISEDWKDIHQRALAGATIHREEESFFRNNGTVQWLRWEVQPWWQSTSTIGGVVIFSEDITDRKHADAALQYVQKQLLEQQQKEKERIEIELARLQEQIIQQTRMAAIGQVSASIAHDLRNPLSAIRNATYLLKRRLATPDEKVQQYLQIIEDEIRAADEIIGDLLEMTRAKEPQKRHIDLFALIRTISAQFHSFSQVEWYCVSDPDPFFVWADPGQLRQVLNNLFLNAIQAMSGSGTIEVKAYCGDHWQEITITDTGPGIPTDKCQQIFEPLFTTKAQGTGLGLTICKQIIERHGGKISVGNAKNQGAVFYLHLPLH